ncbi:GNAT family N-acetyltransferase [Sutcliffiella horikoshii]|uniref:GNAT family N-acetyltransferase n=1 Tax=Sutcliffiella horikoshii TaxID=79883 RepID=UPI00384D0D8A
MNKSLETARIFLRRLELEDADRVEELASDYELAKTTLTVPHPYPAGSATDFIRSMWAAGDKGLVVFGLPASLMRRRFQARHQIRVPYDLYETQISSSLPDSRSIGPL